MPDGLVAATPENSAPVILTRNMSADIITALPAAAADRLQQLRSHVNDLHLLLPEHSERQEANTARYMAEKRLERLQAHASVGGYGLSDDDPRVVEARREVTRLAAEAKIISQRYEQRSAQWTVAGQVLAKCESWLTSGALGNAVIEAVEVETPKLGKDESIADAINRLDQRCREYRADLAKIAAAPIPSAQARAKMRQTIDALARRGEIDVHGLVAYGGDISFPSTQVRALVHNVDQAGAVAFVEVCDTAAVTCWLFSEAIKKKLDDAITAEADDDAALDGAERQRRSSEVQAALLDCEYDLAALVFAGQRQSLPVEFPDTISAQAVLGVELRQATPVEPSPGSGWMHALGIIGAGR